MPFGGDCDTQSCVVKLCVFSSYFVCCLWHMSVAIFILTFAIFICHRLKTSVILYTMNHHKCLLKKSNEELISYENLFLTETLIYFFDKDKIIHPVVSPNFYNCIYRLILQIKFIILWLYLVNYYE